MAYIHIPLTRFWMPDTTSQYIGLITTKQKTAIKHEGIMHKTVNKITFIKWLQVKASVGWHTHPTGMHWTVW